MKRGHAVLPHTADVRIECWASTPAALYEEAVAALVELFADTTEAETAGSAAVVPFVVGPGTPPGLVVLLLEEVLLQLDARNRVPIATHVEVHGDRLVGTFTAVPVDAVQVTGAIPKAVAYEDLVFRPRRGRWWCRATIDV